LTVWFGLVRDIWYSCRLAHVTRCSARVGGLRGACALALALGPETVAREGEKSAAFAWSIGWEGLGVGVVALDVRILSFEATTSM
jgi:hypothetical protein